MPTAMENVENTEQFCRMVQARSREHAEAMQVALARNRPWLSVAGSLLRLELDSLIRATYLIGCDAGDRVAILESCTAGAGFMKPGTETRIPDGEMVRKAALVDPWVRQVYNFGNNFVHLTDAHDYAVTDPLTVYRNRSQVIDFLNRKYGSGTLRDEATFAELVPFAPRVLSKITDDLHGKLTQLQALARDQEFPPVTRRSARASVGQAMDHLHMWAQAVDLQRLRLTSGVPLPVRGPVSQRADCWMFLLSLSRLRHSVKLLRSVAPSDRWAAIDRAAAIFDDNASAGAVSLIRNVLEHSEDYFIGNGREQHSWTHGAPQVLEWSEADDENYVIHLGGVSRTTVVASVDVRQAAGAAAVLMGSLREAVQAARGGVTTRTRSRVRRAGSLYLRRPLR